MRTLLFLLVLLSTTSPLAVLNAAENKEDGADWLATVANVYRAGVGKGLVLRRNRKTRLIKGKKELGCVPALMVTYKVMGKEYDSVLLLEKEGPFLTKGEAQTFGEKWMAARMNDQYKVPVTLYYDPANPKKCNLEKGDVRIQGRRWDDKDDPRR